jgi:hypothetical protein
MPFKCELMILLLVLGAMGLGMIVGIGYGSHKERKKICAVVYSDYSQFLECMEAPFYVEN